MLLAGFTGLFSIGHAAFLGVGAYTQACWRQQGWPFPLSLRRRGAVGRGRRRRRPAGAAREGHLPRHRHAGLRLHRRGGAGALGERHRRQRRHDVGAVRCSAGSPTGTRSSTSCAWCHGAVHAGGAEPAALADRAAPSWPSATARSRRRAWASTWPTTRRCRSRSRRAGRHRRRAVRAQDPLPVARPVQHHPVDRPAADGGDRRPGLRARRLPGRGLPDRHAAG
jgi:hypothetical protein